MHDMRVAEEEFAIITVLYITTLQDTVFTIIVFASCHFSQYVNLNESDTLSAIAVSRFNI